MNEERKAIDKKTDKDLFGALSKVISSDPKPGLLLTGKELLFFIEKLSKIENYQIKGELRLVKRI